MNEIHTSCPGLPKHLWKFVGLTSFVFFEAILQNETLIYGVQIKHPPTVDEILVSDTD